MKNTLIILVLLLITQAVSAQWLTGYSFRKEITINETMISGTSDLTDFPLLINTTDSDLATVANGGKVENSNGWDIRFTLDDGTTLLDHEIESYTETTGALLAWVRIPDLEHDENTVIYIYYGNSGVGSDPSTSSTWNSSYRGVWHHNTNTLDAGQYTNHGTNNGTSDAVGKIGGARYFDGSDNIIVPNTASLNFQEEVTIEAWVRIMPAAPGRSWAILIKQSDYGFNYLLNQQRWYAGEYSQQINITHSQDEWIYLCATYDRSVMTVYVNGSSIGTYSNSTQISNDSSADLGIGHFIGSPSTQFTGYIDELKLMSSSVSEDWIKTSYANQNNPSAFITISSGDIIPPVITCPVDITINCHDDTTPTGTGTASATDDQTAVGDIVITYSDVSTQEADPANANYYNYVLTRTWTAEDEATNSSNCDQIITVQDVTNPTFTQPAGLTLNCDASQLPANTGDVTAADMSDNCAADANLTVTYSDASTQNADPANIGYYNYTITRTWRVTDVANNFTEHDQVITVQDITNPTITCPADITINCEDDSTPTGTGTATATDNCALATNITITYSDVSTQGDDPALASYYNYTTTRTWRSTDPAGNFDECVQVITVQDVTNPTITCPADVTINCEDDSTPAGTGTATATDNCALAANITITYSDVSTQGGDPALANYYNYTITRTWRATDPSTNFDECVQVITVQDVTNPTNTCPADITINCEDDSTPTGTATATDNCALAADITITFSDLSTQGGDPALANYYNYTITRTLTATDPAGNFSECVQVITLEDNTAPEISCLNDINVDLDTNCEYTVPDFLTSINITDGCDANPTSSQSPLPGTILSGAGIVQEIVIMALDVSGNSQECRFNITLIDNSLPEVVSLRDTLIILEDGSYYIDLELPNPIFSDNCGLSSIVNDFNGLDNASGNYAFGTTLVVYTVTDINGNTENFSQEIEVQISDMPANGLIIPEGISPNNDGLNDRFVILGLEKYPVSRLQIFNSVGNEVYSSPNYNNEWDGISNRGSTKGKELPGGNYYYIIYLPNDKGIIKGFIYLQRE